MSVQKIISFVLLFTLLATTSVYAEDFSVSAERAILMEASEGRILYEKGCHDRAPMASTTKIMTAILALESGDLSRQVTIAPEAVGIEGSSIYLKESETLTMEQLVYALMLQSANDAAAAIAIEIAGSIEAFAEKMNLKAAELGLVDTHFTNPHGLDNEMHYTTAYDLAVLTAYGLQNPQFAEIVSTAKMVIPLNGDEGSRVLINHNRLLKSYEGMCGVKTGFTKKSGRCLVSAAEKDGLTLIAVTLNAPDDWNDHRKMLDYGFDALEIREIASVGDYNLKIDCVGGVTTSVSASNSTALSIIMPKWGEREIRAVNELPRFLFAPIKKGEKLGEIVFYEGVTRIGSVEVVADETVNATTYPKTFFEKIKHFFAA